MVGEYDRDQLVRFLRGRSCEYSLAELARALTDSGTEVHALLLAVLQCERQITHALTQASLHNGYLLTLARHVDRFRDIKQALIGSVGDASPDTSQVKQPMDAELLKTCQSAWLRDGRILLHNYFHEMPITAHASVLKVNGLHLTITMGSDVGRVFTVADDGHAAFVTTPDQKHVLRLSATRYHNGKVTMVVHGLDEVGREQRVNLRIQLDQMSKVSLSSHGMMTEARMRDISTGGIGLEIDGEIDIHRGAMIGALWEFNDGRIFVESTVRWVLPKENGCRVGLQFRSLGPFSETVQQFLLSEQHKLIDRLRTLSLPAWMQEE